MHAGGEITFSQISRAYSEAAAAQGVPRERCTTASVLLLMAKLGELASFAATAGGGMPSRNAFEVMEITELIGSIAIATCALGVGFGVDVGEAAFLASRGLKKSHLPPSSAPPPANAPAHFLPAAGAASPSATHQPQQHVISSPGQQVKPSADTNQPSFDALLGSPKPDPRPPALSAPLSAGPPNPSAPAPLSLAMSESCSDDDTRNVLISPKTNSSFWAMLDLLLHSPGIDVSSLNMTFAIPRPNGMVVDLVPNGRHIKVKRENFQQFLDLAAPFRPGGPPPPRGQSASSPSANETPRVYKIEAPPAYDAAQQQALYSPEHFSRNLFSPHATTTEFHVTRKDISVPEALRRPLPLEAPSTTSDARGSTSSGATAAPPSIGPGHSGGPGPSAAENDANLARSFALPPAVTPGRGSAEPHASVDSGNESSGAAKGDMSPFGSQGASAYEPAAYWSAVAAIRNKSISGHRIDELKLTFVFPEKNGKPVELVANGTFIPVTHQNAATFLSLVQERLSVSEGHIKRMDSVKTIAVPNLDTYDPRATQKRYSPSHYALDLFAPHTNKTAFWVDYDEQHAAEVLPPALQRGIKSVIATPEEYVEYISANPERFKDIFVDLRKDPEVAKRMSVTYCKPDRPGTVHDLVEDGRNVVVAVGDVPRFLELVMSATRRASSRSLLELVSASSPNSAAAAATTSGAK